MERESMEFDVVIVGAGPAGLAAACRLGQMAARDGVELRICVVEKGAEVGAHIVSGAVIEPRGLDELFPDWRERGAPLDLIVCNPPYVEPSEADSLAPEVREYEPEAALFAPEGDPDHWLLALLDSGRELIAEDGSMLVELGHRQGARAISQATERGWSARLHADLSGVERVFEAQRA